MEQICFEKCVGGEKVILIWLDFVWDKRHHPLACIAIESSFTKNDS